MAPDPELEALEMRLLFEAILARYGYDLKQYARKSMERRIRAVLARSGLHNLGELQHKVLSDAAFFTSMLEDLTVPVSALFRDPSMYTVFREQVVPMLRSYPTLKIWHAGCASGEEAYAMAILLLEEGLYERTQIYATDLSVKMLEHAKEGVYPISKLEQYAKNYLEAGGKAELSVYYTAAYDHIAMKDALRKNILFFQHNLASDYVFGEMHVIFCRNVFIYFEDALRERVLRKFTESLCAGGFLCLGSSERLPQRHVGNTFTELSAQERIYRHAALS